MSSRRPPVLVVTDAITLLAEPHLAVAHQTYSGQRGHGKVLEKTAGADMCRRSAHINVKMEEINEESLDYRGRYWVWT
jgi:hypothetical protein